MNKNQFLHHLNESLKRLPKEEREDVVGDFEEHFRMAAQEGKTEEQIAQTLGSPKQIAKEILATSQMDKVEDKATAGNIFRATWAIIGLSFFNLVIVLGPFIALVGILFGGWVAGLSFIVSPLLIAINTLIFPETFVLFELFLSITLAGIGILLAIGMFHATRSLSKLFVRYLQYNMNVVKGGMKNEST